MVEAGLLVVSDVKESNDDRDDDGSQESWERNGRRRRKTMSDKSVDSIASGDVQAVVISETCGRMSSTVSSLTFGMLLSVSPRKLTVTGHFNATKQETYHSKDLST
jgi:hypothetical protein